MQDGGIVRIVVVARVAHRAVDPGGVMRRNSSAEHEDIGLGRATPLFDETPTTMSTPWRTSPPARRTSVSPMFILTASTTAPLNRAESSVAANRARSIARSCTTRLR